MYTLVLLVMVAGAFYAGLRASTFITGGTSNPNVETDALRIGREAFERGDFRLAATEFEALVRKDPSNAGALYWLGRAHLERREYEKAAKSFEEAALKQPGLFDAYVQQAAAYEAMGEKVKAAAALLRYAEERRKQERVPLSDER
jgi:tetratricopeptide (TPR) repeat protein